MNNNDLQYCIVKLSQSRPTALGKVRDVLDGRSDQRDVLLHKHEAAKMLSVSRSILWRFLKTDVLPIVDLNGVERIRLSDVQSLMSSSSHVEKSVTPSRQNRTKTLKSKAKTSKNRRK